MACLTHWSLQHFLSLLKKWDLFFIGRRLCSLIPLSVRGPSSICCDTHVPTGGVILAIRVMSLKRH